MDGNGVLRAPDGADAAVSDAARGAHGLHARDVAGDSRGGADLAGDGGGGRREGASGESANSESANSERAGGEPSMDGVAQGGAWSAFETIRAFVTGQLNVAQSVADGQRSASMLLDEAEDELDGLKREFERFRLPTGPEGRL